MESKHNSESILKLFKVFFSIFLAPYSERFDKQQSDEDLHQIAGIWD